MGKTKLERLINEIMREAEADGEPVTREEAEEMAKMELGAKDIKRYEQQDKPRKKMEKERKVDERKKEFIDKILEVIKDFNVSDISILNEAEIHFTDNSDNYTIKLIKHRKPKEKKS